MRHGLKGGVLLHLIHCALVPSLCPHSRPYVPHFWEETRNSGMMLFWTV